MEKMRIRSGWSSPIAGLLAVVAAAVLSLPAGAVIIETGDGTGNTSAPPSGGGNLGDPGWDYVGVVGGLSAVYIRNGWMLTANHVGPGTVMLGGTSYSYVPGTAVQLTTLPPPPLSGDEIPPDLMVFGITPIPALPELPIRSNANLPSGPVILIGNGRNRGAATDSDDSSIWKSPPDPQPDPPIPGWLWGGGRTLRWGVNVVEDDWLPHPYDTVSFYTTFDYPTAQNHEPDEAQAADGDSGGAVFAKQGNTWELAGTMFVVGLYGWHKNNSVLRGEATGIADLSYYRDEILSLTAAEPVPEPDGLAGLGAGLVVLAVLARRRIEP